MKIKPQQMWYVATCGCPICGSRFVGVFPIEANLDCLECRDCHGMEAVAVHFWTPKDIMNAPLEMVFCYADPLAAAGDMVDGLFHA